MGLNLMQNYNQTIEYSLRWAAINPLSYGRLIWLLKVEAGLTLDFELTENIRFSTLFDVICALVKTFLKLYTWIQYPVGFSNDGKAQII